jgi:hypothetical protein
VEALAQLAAWSLLVFAIILFATQVAAREFGYWLRQRQAALHGSGEAEGVGLVVGGMIGILALTLSFGSKPSC